MMTEAPQQMPRARIHFDHIVWRIDKCLEIFPEYEKTLTGLKALYVRNRDRISRSPGSSHNHQVWEGGYVDHLMHMLDFAVSQDWSVTNRFFTEADVILVILLHDIEKPWKYVEPCGSYPDLSDIPLTDYQRDALKYIHGEGTDYRSDKRVMNELAAYVHICDVWSARIRYNDR